MSVLNVKDAVDILEVVKVGTDFSELSTLGFLLTDSALTAERASTEGLCGLDVNPERWIIC